jgi:hypothetical protein
MIQEKEVALNNSDDQSLNESERRVHERPDLPEEEKLASKKFKETAEQDTTNKQDLINDCDRLTNSDECPKNDSIVNEETKQAESSNQQHPEDYIQSELGEENAFLLKKRIEREVNCELETKTQPEKSETEPKEIVVDQEIAKLNHESTEIAQKEEIQAIEERTVKNDNPPHDLVNHNESESETKAEEVKSG